MCNMEVEVWITYANKYVSCMYVLYVCMYECMYVYSSYIPQTEQHEPKGQMLFSLGNVTYLLDVTPSNSLPHPLPPPPILLHVI